MLAAIIIAIGIMSVLSATTSCDAKGFDEPAKSIMMASVAPEPTTLAMNDEINSSFHRIRLCSIQTYAERLFSAKASNY